jgi:hypothetical protein
MPQQGESMHDWTVQDTKPDHQAPVPSDYFFTIGQMSGNARISILSFDDQILRKFTLTTRLQQSSGSRALGL